MKSTSELMILLNGKFKAAAKKQRLTQEYTSMICHKYGFPTSLINDYLTMRVKLTAASDIEVFCIADIVLGEEALHEYYTETQIKRYSMFRFRMERFDNLKLPMIKVADDQWVGSIDGKLLISLGDAQIIRYNEDTQRTLERIVVDGVESWRIYVNDSAVNAIMAEYKAGNYIPNTITLNVLDDNAEIDYNEETHELILTNIEKLDIIDGFHRYLALSKIIHEDRHFNYNMELRIVNFSEMKARQFIWQEDQKTQMKKIDSYSYNQTTASSKVVRRLNRIDDDNVFGGRISNNENLINESILTLAIDQIYMKGIPVPEQPKYVNETIADIQHKFETITQADPNLLIKRWDRDYIISAIYAFKNYQGDEANLLNCVNALYNNKGDKHLYVNRGQKYVLNTSLLADLWKVVNGNV